MSTRLIPAKNGCLLYWAFLYIALLLSSLSGCAQPVPFLPGTATAPAHLTLAPLDTPTPVSTLTSTLSPLPTTFTPPAAPSTTATPEAVSLTLWAEWQLDYEILTAAWSPDSQRIVFSGADLSGPDYGTIMYDVNTLQQIWQVRNAASFITFSPDKNTLISTDNAIRFWDAASGKIIDTCCEGNAILMHVFLPDSTLLVGRSWIHGGHGTEYGITEIGLLDKEQKRLNIIIEHEGDITTFEVSPDGKLLITAMALLPEPQTGRRVFVWDLADKNIHCDFPDYYDAVFSPVDNVLAAIGSYGNITLFDISTCQPFRTIHEAEFVYSFSFSPDGKMLAYAGRPDGVIWVQNVANGELLYQEGVFPGLIEQLEFSPDGRYLLILGNNVVQIWEVQR